MKEDIQEAKEVIEDLDEAESKEWKAIFDPNAFNEINKPLTLNKFKLDTDILQDYAIIMTKIRKQIEEKAGLK